MTNMNNFSPDWISAPGATILDLLEERGYSVRSFADATNRGVQEVSRLLYGIERLNEDWAHKLATVLGSTPGFWIRRETQYREDLERLSSQAQEDEAKEWLREIPTKDMARFGWINAGSTAQDSMAGALAFFGVGSVSSWRRHYGGELTSAAFRSSTAFETKVGGVAAWLRQGEISATEIDCAPWNAAMFRQALSEAKALTRISDPCAFIPQLVEAFSKCGVAVVIARAPSGCRASGATRFLSQNKAVMLLSFRYLTDDQFWFTVFHEAGHLLLHTHNQLFLEGVEASYPDAETEANYFSKEVLFTQTGLAEIKTIPLNQFSIARLAKRLGVCPGLVVGQLQELGRVPYKHFNYLKIRYSWSND
jgi:plasmid maintenance system antidote protein VapI